jgi:uncharacterized protein
VQTLTVSVAELLGRPGEYRDIRVAEPVAGVGNALARLTDDPVEAGLRAESVIEGVLVTGHVSGSTALQCARCLIEFPSTVDVDVCELYVAPGHGAPADDDTYRVQGTEIHLEAMLRDAITLAIPLQPLCREDCKGICASCGADLNSATCTCVEDDTDPRWAPLENLKQRLGQG